MTAESRCATTRDGAYHFQMLNTESMTINEVVAPRAEDVGHLHGGPRHGCCFRLLDRLIAAMLDTDMASTGLVTACKCNRDKCR